MSFIWTVGCDAEIYTHLLFSHYTSPYKMGLEKESEDFSDSKKELYY
jgi:hypothetical protein